MIALVERSDNKENKTKQKRRKGGYAKSTVCRINASSRASLSTTPPALTEARALVNAEPRCTALRSDDADAAAAAPAASAAAVVVMGVVAVVVGLLLLRGVVSSAPARS